MLSAMGLGELVKSRHSPFLQPVSATFAARSVRFMTTSRLSAQSERVYAITRGFSESTGAYSPPISALWLHFSVSHSGGLWVCALCRCDVGIDIEQHAARDHAALSRRFFHPNEIEYTRRGGTDAFYSVWTAKESYVKLLGTGIGGSFSHFSVVERGEISGDRLFARFTSIPVREGYSLTLCR